MSDQIEELIREIAVKHGIAVSRDDPILVLQTINNRLMQDSAKSQETQLHVFKEEMEALTVRWGKDSHEKAERILNAALLAGKAAMVKNMQDGAEAAGAAIRGEVEAGVVRLEAQVHQARQIAVIGALASCIALLAAGFVFWATVH